MTRPSRLLPALFVFLWGCGDRGSPPAPASAPRVLELFPLEGLDGWRQLDDLIGGGGPVAMESGVLTLGAGNPVNAIVLEASRFPIPDAAYEIEVEAMRVEGRDIFCGLTFPVPGRDACVTLVAGGWGGATTGISSIDGRDASANETMSVQRYENGRWYAIRVRAEPDYLQVWIDGRTVAAINIRGRQVGLRVGEVEQCQPLGFLTWETTARLRDLRVRLSVGG